MSQIYVTRPVTRLESSITAVSHISVLKSSEGPVGPPAHVIDSILALPLPNLKQHLEAATSDEMRILPAFMGLGKAGTKEANKVLIFEEVEKR